jgi:hypothetical protein
VRSDSHIWKSEWGYSCLNIEFRKLLKIKTVFLDKAGHQRAMQPLGHFPGVHWNFQRFDSWQSSGGAYELEAIYCIRICSFCCSALRLPAGMGTGDERNGQY